MNIEAGIGSSGALALSGALSEVRTSLSRSIELNRQAGDVLALEVVQTVDFDCPIYVETARGCRMTDVDGNSYIDLTMGFGAHVLGLNPPQIRKEIQAQTQRGWHFGIHNERQKDLAELIRLARPSNEQIAFCNSGTEATMYAFRLARAITGKQKIGVFDGSYHGAHDYALAKVDPKSEPANPGTVLDGAGIPPWVRSEATVALPYAHEASFDLIRRHARDLALVCVQPIQNNNPSVAQRAWLGELIEVCRRNNVLCLFDEVVTGFRLAYGGAQELFDLQPDFTVYGKALGGGLPIGAIAGPFRILRHFKSASSEKGVFFGGTFNGNPLAMAAGVGALRRLHSGRETIYSSLAAKSDRLVREINSFATRHQMEFQAINAGSLICFHFQSAPISTYRDLQHRGSFAERLFYIALLKRGVIVPAIHLAFLSDAHSEEDVTIIIKSVKGALLDVRSSNLI